VLETLLDYSLDCVREGPTTTDLGVLYSQKRAIKILLGLSKSEERKIQVRARLDGNSTPALAALQSLELISQMKPVNLYEADQKSRRKDDRNAMACEVLLRLRVGDKVQHGIVYWNRNKDGSMAYDGKVQIQNMPSGPHIYIDMKACEQSGFRQPPLNNTEIEFVAGKDRGGRDRVIIFQVNYGLGHGGGDRGRGHGADGGDVELDNASGPVEQQAVLPSPAALLEEGATIVAQAQPGDAAEAAADAAPRDPEVDSLHNVFQRLSVTEQIAVPPTPPPPSKGDGEKV
jgi:hypothetical protein